MKKLLLAICLATAQTALAQTADTRIGTLINESNWFELKRTMEVTPLNRPDSACIAIGTVLNEHQEEIGGQNSVNMAALMATNLTRCTRYEEAAALMQSLAQQLQAQGVDTATTASILKAADLYTMYSRRPTFTQCMPASRPSAARFIRQANTTSPSRSTTTCTRDTRSRDTS